MSFTRIENVGTSSVINISSVCCEWQRLFKVDWDSERMIRLPVRAKRLPQGVFYPFFSVSDRKGDYRRQKNSDCWRKMVLMILSVILKPRARTQIPPLKLLLLLLLLFIITNKRIWLIFFFILTSFINITCYKKKKKKNPK